MSQFISRHIISLRYKKEPFYFPLLFIITVIVIYKAPTIITTLYQILLLILFYRSKRDYFWLAFMIIIQSSPGALFLKVDTSHPFALLPDSPFGILYFWIVFTLIALIKSIRFKPVYTSFLRENIIFLAAYLLILLLFFGVYKIPSTIRMLLPWTMLFILPRLIRQEKDYVYFFKLIFPFVFFVLITQFYTLWTGNAFATLLGGITNPSSAGQSIEEANQALRPTEGILIPFLSILGSTIFLIYKKKYFSRFYLILILGLSLFSIFLTATRAWMISSIFIAAVFILLYVKSPTIIVTRLLLPVILLFLITNYSPFLKKQANLALDRYKTVTYLLEGDITAGGTSKRFSERGPRVMKKFYESPVIGWGYGQVGLLYGDGHVGHQTLLMNTGIVGYSLFLILWLTFITRLIRRNQKLADHNPYKKIPILLVTFLFGILIIHTTSQWFGYLVSYTTGFTISFLFTFSNFIYYESVRYNHSLNNSRLLI